MSESVFVLTGGDEIPVIITTKRGMRNITLRPKTCPKREIHISKPFLASVSAALKFLESKRRWIEKIYDKVPQKVCVVSGDELSVCGRRIRFVHDEARRGNLLVGDVLYVGGGAEMFERRVRDWVKAEFLHQVKAMIKSSPQEFWPKRIAIRDTTSRWGSCSTTGTMSFSWRLAFAPLDVMRYVVMHELAHVRHMDHSPEFWATVRELYGFGVERAKRWLVQNGGTLHQYF